MNITDLIEIKIGLSLVPVLLAIMFAFEAHRNWKDREWTGFGELVYNFVLTLCMSLISIGVARYMFTL